MTKLALFFIKRTIRFQDICFIFHKYKQINAILSLDETPVETPSPTEPQLENPSPAVISLTTLLLIKNSDDSFYTQLLEQPLENPFLTAISVDTQLLIKNPAYGPPTQPSIKNPEEESK